jgi:uncharacterized protein (DUF2267 family)
MEYQSFLDSAKQLDFINDDQTADAAVKSVLGLLSSKLDEQPAQRLTAELPEPLTYERLRSHQASPTPTAVQDAPAVIAQDVPQLIPEQANQVLHQVLKHTKRSLPEPARLNVEDHLPEGWRAMFDAV